MDMEQVSRAVLGEHNLHTRTGMGLFGFKPIATKFELCSSQNSCTEGALSKGGHGVPRHPTLSSVVLHLQTVPKC